MRVYKDVFEKSDFEFWGQAVENVNRLTGEEFENFIDTFNEIDECALNDIFSYYIDEVLETLCIDEEEFFNRGV